MTVLRAVLDLSTGQFKKGLKEAQGAAATAGKKIGEGIKQGAKAATVAMAGIGVASVKMAADFEKGFAEVATLFDGPAKKQIPELKKQILALKPELGSATELTAGLYQALSAGADPSKAVAFVAQAAKLAKAGLADMDSTVKVLAGNINAYGEKSAEAASVSDMLFTVVKRGVVQMPELASALGQVSGTAAAAGVSQQELFGAIASITKAGIPASQAITGIKAAISNVIKPTKEAEELAQKLGVGFGASALKSKGLVGLLSDLEAKTGGNTEQMAKFFGSVEGLNAVLALSKGQLSGFKEDVAAMGEASAKAGGVTDEAFAKQTATLNAGIAAVGNAIQKIGIEIGNELIPNVKDAVTFVLDHMGQIKDGARGTVGFLKDSSDLLAGFARLVGGDLAGAEEKFANVAKMVKDTFPGLQKVIETVTDVIIDLVDGKLMEVVNRFKGAASGVFEFVKSIPGGISSYFGGATVETGNKASRERMLAALRNDPGNQGLRDALNLGPKDAIPAFASGGTSAGGTALVGEKGPELVNLPAGSQVLSAEKTSAMIQASRERQAGLGMAGPAGSSELHELIAKTFGSGAAAGAEKGLIDGTKKAGGKTGGSQGQGKKTGVSGMLFDFSEKGLIGGLMSGMQSGDVGDSIKDFASRLGEGAKRQIVMNIKRSLSSALVNFLGLGGLSFPGFANGGVTPGGWVRVGERGPELARLPQGTRVYSNAESEQMMGANRPMVNIERLEVPGGGHISEDSLSEKTARILAEMLAELDRKKQIPEFSMSFGGSA